MNVKRIVAKTSREAMRQLRDVLGPQAVILSNRAVDGGVEVLAMASEDIAAMAPPVVERPLSSPASQPAENPTEAQAVALPRFNRSLIDRIAASSQASIPTQATVSNQDSAQLAQSVLSEIKAMQTSLENQLAELT